MEFFIDDLKPFSDFLDCVNYDSCVVAVQYEKVLGEFKPILTFKLSMRMKDFELFKQEFEGFKIENSDKIVMYYFDNSTFTFSGRGANFFMKWLGR